MDRIAFVIGDIFIYWNSIILTLAAATAICFFLAFFLGSGGKGSAAAVGVPVAMVLSIFLSRLVHWYFRPDSYSGFMTAMTDYAAGNYALMGVFLGCGLTAVLLWALRLEKSLGTTLDAMCMGGAAGIAVGRLAGFFSAADRGQILSGSWGLPFAYPVANVVTGAPENRLATFLIQSMAAALIFVVLLAFWFLARRKKGDLTLIFLLIYGMSQAVLDSTRYDSLFMRSNGFVSAVQISGAAAVVIISAVFSVKMVRARGFRGWYIVLWVVMAGLMGGAGYMEYFVQRHGDRAMFSYSIMTVCLSSLVSLALITFALAGRGRKINR